jgi:hypothetical protein
MKKTTKEERRRKYPNKCTECFQDYNRNYWNEYKFELDLWNKTRTLEDWSVFQGHSRLNLSICDFVGNNRDQRPSSTWTLYLDENLGESEVCVGEEMPIEQLERLYEFLKVSLKKG